MESINQMRRLYKWQAIQLRGGPNYATCDITGKRIGATGDLHEIILRSLTVSNDDARLLSYRPELTAYLSQDAHRAFHDKAPTEEQRNAMFFRLYQLHGIHNGGVIGGYEIVKKAFNEVQCVLGIKLNFDIPKPKDEQCHTNLN